MTDTPVINTLLIDADMLVHRSCVAVEKDTRFLDRYHLLFSDAEEAWGLLMETLGELGSSAGTENYVFCFSDPTRKNWRSAVDDNYKADRSVQRKPLAYWATVERIKEYFKSKVIHYDNFEGDDVLGFLQTLPENPHGTTAIWSLDKDLKQIPGYHLMDDEIVHISEAEADQFHMFQTLAGDITDGYSGCPGIGKDRALKALQNMTKVVPIHHILRRGPRKGLHTTKWEEEEASSMWEVVLSQYEKACDEGRLYRDPFEEALTNARLSRILRHEDIDDNGEVILWNPE